MTNKTYEPELGQALFGQPSQMYACPEYVESHLESLERELERVMWNVTQEDFASPFSNTGNEFKNETFEVHAYNWGDESQPFNFKWKEYEISWYKYLGRGMSINKPMSPEVAAEMLDECLTSIRAMDKTLDL